MGDDGIILRGNFHAGPALLMGFLEKILGDSNLFSKIRNHRLKPHQEMKLIAQFSGLLQLQDVSKSAQPSRVQSYNIGINDELTSLELLAEKLALRQRHLQFPFAAIP